MAKNVVIRGNEYDDVPEVAIPQVGGGTARFIDPSGATIDSGNKLLDGVKAIGPDGTLYDGTIPEKDGDDLTVSGGTVTVPAGHYAQQASKAVPNGAVTPPASASDTGATVSVPSANTLKLSKQVSMTPVVSTPGYIAAGTAGNVQVELQASVPTQAAQTITPGTSDQEIAAGTYLSGKQTVKGDANLKSSSIVEGTSIFGVNGSAKVPLISQDATTKILSIS